jgi:hypothetical protein
MVGFDVVIFVLVLAMPPAKEVAFAALAPVTATVFLAALAVMFLFPGAPTVVVAALGLLCTTLAMVAVTRRRVVVVTYDPALFAVPLVEEPAEHFVLVAVTDDLF